MYIPGLTPPPWAVLGGGGLRGMAHIGAWRAFEEDGISVSGIVGTSIGALMAVCLGGGMGWEDLAQRARKLKREDIVRVNRRAIWINGVKCPSLYQGESLRAYIASVLPVQRWSELTVPVQVNAVSLETGETEWFGMGARTDVSPVDAVYASAALPVLYPPALLDGQHFVDGGTLDALPLRRARDLGASRILAVDVGSAAEADGKSTVAGGMVAIHQRVFSIMSGSRRRESLVGWSGPPLLFVRPDVDRYSAFAFDAVESMIQEGFRAARRELKSSGGQEGASTPSQDR